MVAELLFIHFGLVGNLKQAIQNIETLEVWRMDVTTSPGCELCSLCYNNQLTVIISGSYLLCAVVVIMNQNLKTSFHKLQISALMLTLRFQHYLHLQSSVRLQFKI